MVGTGRIELPTSSVSGKRSPTELRASRNCKDGRRAARVFNLSPITLGLAGRSCCLARVYSSQIKQRNRSNLLPNYPIPVNLAEKLTALFFAARASRDRDIGSLKISSQGRSCRQTRTKRRR